MSASQHVYLLVLSAALNVALLFLCVYFGLSFSSPVPNSQESAEDLQFTNSKHIVEKQLLVTSHESLGGPLHLTSIIDPTTKEVSQNVKYSDIARALVDEFMPGSEKEISWKNLEEGLQAMQIAEKMGYRPNPSGRLAKTSYNDLRRAITAKYFVNGSLSLGLEIMYKLENGDNDGKPIAIEGQPYLFVGSAGPAYNLTALKEMNITHIISVTSRVQPQFPDEFEYLHIPGIRDEPEDPKQSLIVHFNKTTAFIDKARNSGGRCYVHCWGGRSRSVTVVAAYLIQREEMTREGALKLIRKTRPMARPNNRFMSELETFSLDVLSKIAHDSDERLSTNMHILKSDGSLADWVHYSTLRRALGNRARILVDKTSHGEKGSWKQMKICLDSMRRSEAYTDITNFEGPLANVTYSKLEKAILDRFPLNSSNGKMQEVNASQGAVGTSNTQMDNNKWHRLALSLWVMRQMEIDGEPVPIDYFWGGTWRPWPHKLFIGSIGAAYNLPVLIELGITHIVAISKQHGKIYPDHFEYFHVSGVPGNSSSQGLYKYFDSSYQFIKGAIRGDGKVLVYCGRGLSRSATILSAFFIRHKKTSARKALGIVRQTRSSAAPRQVFVEELEKYAQKIQMRQEMLQYLSRDDH